MPGVIDVRGDSAKHPVGLRPARLRHPHGRSKLHGTHPTMKRGLTPSQHRHSPRTVPIDKYQAPPPPSLFLHHLFLHCLSRVILLYIDRILKAKSFTPRKKGKAQSNQHKVINSQLFSSFLPIPCCVFYLLLPRHHYLNEYLTLNNVQDGRF